MTPPASAVAVRGSAVARRPQLGATYRGVPLVQGVAVDVTPPGPVLEPGQVEWTARRALRYDVGVRWLLYTMGTGVGLAFTAPTWVWWTLLPATVAVVGDHRSKRAAAWLWASAQHVRHDR